MYLNYFGKNGKTFFFRKNTFYKKYNGTLKQNFFMDTLIQ